MGKKQEHNIPTRSKSHTHSPLQRRVFGTMGHPLAIDMVRPSPELC